MSDPKFELPAKVDSFLSMLNRFYERSGEALLREIVVNGTVSIDEGSDYDNWNGGTYGHTVKLTVSGDLFLQVFPEKDTVQRRIAENLDELAQLL